MEVQNKQTIIIDLRRGSTVPLPHFTQYDTNILEFVVKDKGVDADLSAVTNIVVNYKPRNKEAITRTLEANGNVVTYTIGEEEMRTTGIADVSLSFFEGEKRLSTAKLKLYMNDSLGPYFEGGEGMPLLQELFVEVAASSQQTTEAANYAMEKGAEAEQAATAALEAAESARSNPLAPVADFAAIATTYPDPQPGDETQTLDDGKVYRYLNGEWQYIRELTPGPVAALSEQLAETVKQVNGKTPDANGNVTIDVPEVDTTNLATKTELQAVASGSPKGAYATLNDLQAAHPTGDAGIYVVAADGNWYYWNGAAWSAGGVYQSTEWFETLTTQDQIWEV